VCTSFVPPEEQVETWLREFDLDVDGTISEVEFETGIKKWAKRVAKDKLSNQKRRSSAVNIQDSDFWAAKSNDAKTVSTFSHSSYADPFNSDRQTPNLHKDFLHSNKK